MPDLLHDHEGRPTPSSPAPGPAGGSPPRVVLAGAHGHGSFHLRNIRRLARDGALTLAGVCDTVPVAAEALAGLGDPPQAGDLTRLLDEVRPDITVVCTPIHTHADLAVAAMEHGSHVLLEKPPAPGRAEFERIRSAAERTGRACQVGFQDLASEALPAIARLIGSGAIGTVRGVGGACAWVRPTSYFRRSAWAGRRELDGRAVVDGALTNPFAHAVASALRIADATALADVTALEVELYRTNPIEADDTSCVRIHTRGGVPVTVAATLCAAADHDPYLVVHGTRGRITLYYKRGEVRAETEEGRSTTVHPRADLLENLVAHVTRPDAVPLRVPLAATEAFMAVVETVRTAPTPAAITVPAGLRIQDDHGERFVVPGIDDLVAESAERLSLYAELGAVWATYPVARVTPPPVARATAAPPSQRGAGTEAETSDPPELRVGATAVARYEDGGSLDRALSPRPYLHPVRTMSGTTVTDACPEDHRWHLGVSVGLQDVNKTNFWGGRTYVRDRGYQWLPDHGHVRRAAWSRQDAGHLAERLEWVGHDGTVLLHEHRSLRASDVPVPGAWRLDVEFRLENVTGEPVELGSPATNGRERAGYGGFFWRLPPHDGSLEVFTAGASGEDAVHGSVTGWLAVTGAGAHGRPWSVLIAHDPATPVRDPWFVRVRDYPGAGASLAWSEPVVLDPGDTAGRSFRAVIVDGRADGVARAERWLRLAGASPRADAGSKDGE